LVWRAGLQPGKIWRGPGGYFPPDGLRGGAGGWGGWWVGCPLIVRGRFLDWGGEKRTLQGGKRPPPKPSTGARPNFQGFLFMCQKRWAKPVFSGGTGNHPWAQIPLGEVRGGGIVAGCFEAAEGTGLTRAFLRGGACVAGPFEWGQFAVVGARNGEPFHGEPRFNGGNFQRASFNLNQRDGE